MMRDSLLAPERTMTQCRDTERTQCAFCRFGADDAVLATDATGVTGFVIVAAAGAGAAT